MMFIKTEKTFVRKSLKSKHIELNHVFSWIEVTAFLFNILIYNPKIDENIIQLNGTTN